MGQLLEMERAALVQVHQACAKHSDPQRLLSFYVAPTGAGSLQEATTQARSVLW